VRREPARAPEDRADVRRFAVPPRLRPVVARLFGERVLARFLRRVLLAIVGPPLVEWDAKSWLKTFRCARSFDGPDGFPFGARPGEDLAAAPENASRRNCAAALPDARSPARRRRGHDG
jgi:hypothetical protein